MNAFTAQLFDFKNIDQPYNSMWEYYEDCTNLINLKMLFLLLYEQKSDKLGIMKNELFESGNEFFKLLMKCPAIFSRQFAAEEYMDHMVQCEQYLDARRMVSINAELFLPDVYLSDVFELSSFEHNCVLLAFVSSLDPKYEKVFAFANDNSSRKNATAEIALKIFTNNNEKAHENIKAFLPHSKLMRFFIYHKKNQDNTSYYSVPLCLNNRINRFLTDPSSEESDMAFPFNMIQLEDEPEKLIVNSQLVDVMANILFLKENKDYESTALVNLFGLMGSGKKLLFKHLCKRSHRRGMVIDCLKLSQENEKLYDELLYICRESIIRQSFIFLDKLDKLYTDKNDTRKLHVILRLLSEHISIIFAASENEIPSYLVAEGIRLNTIEVPSPDTGLRISLWEWFSKGKKLQSSINISELANKFNFTPGQIKKSLSRAAYESELKGLNYISINILYDSCYRQIVHNLKESASLIKPAYSWDDLVIPSSEIETLKASCNHIKYAHMVFNEWGFNKRLPYGRGLSMLFSGPPGTGKTMSAQVIANELHMEMYKIQLSKIVSKYIGETEKNLKAIFDEANKSNVILFFDETDALFGKRSEIKDSHDRYANIEVAYLLQEIEEHEGITIMATNYMKNIDEAFLRRINYIIHFPFPDEKARTKIWGKIFPESAPLSKDVDYGFLARKFEIPGGNIKNIAVSSAFQAASENSEITMKHIIKAAIHEQKKSNKVIVGEDLEEYSDLL